MNCAHHPDLPAVAYCRACGKALCQSCQRTAQGTIYCEEHMPREQSMNAGSAPPGASPWSAAPPPAGPPPACRTDLSVSPGIAFLLGFIPGVGAIYNGQYAKGLIHVVILGLLISVASSSITPELGGLIGLMIAAWFFYMAFEAYHTAKKRQLGLPVDEFSSIAPLRGRPGRLPVAPVLLIALGVLFLLINFDLIRFRDVIRFWPVFLIALGVYMLWVRLSGDPAVTANREAANEHR
jgi:TM2 domain-containing membrane protein YozV